MALPSQCRLLEHPLLDHKMAQLRDQKTTPKSFREIMRELSRVMAYEVTRDLKTGKQKIQTPIEEGEFSVVEEDLILVSILRAGNGMIDGFLDMVPFARVGHIGIYRDKFIGNTVEYYFKLPPNAKGKRVIVVDPMLATAATAVAAIERLKEYGVGSIDLACLLAAPEGLANLVEAHPDVQVTTLSIDRQLNEKGYICPGLGDAGDRVYGTV